MGKGLKAIGAVKEDHSLLGGDTEIIYQQYSGEIVEFESCLGRG